MSRKWDIAGEAFEEYEATLRGFLDDRAYRLFSLKTNAARVTGSLDSFLAHADPRSGTLLNVGSGAFALESLLERATRWRILSIDPEASYGALYRDLRGKGLLGRTQFVVADVRESEFVPRSFGAILVHDVLFTPTLDLFALLPRFARWLRPDGTLYFDVWDRRARFLWGLAGRNHGFRRYDLHAVREGLRSASFRIVAEKPYFGSRGGLRMLRKVLWATLRLSNTRHFIAKRSL